MSAGTKWVLAIFGLLTANVLAMVVLVASSGARGAQVIPDYYDRAAHFDRTLDEGTRSRALGWHVATSFAVDHGSRTIAISVVDAAGKPLDGAHVVVQGYQRAYASDTFELELVRISAGRYGGLAQVRAGRSDVAITVDRGGEVFVDHATLDVP
jgi:nitrogen fixation protein FixH